MAASSESSCFVVLTGIILLLQTLWPTAGQAMPEFARKYSMSCAACHASGAAGAPKLGDTGAWAPRIAQGMDALVSNAINGLNAMPPKGLCMTCSDADLKAAVEYMASQSQ